MNRWLYGSSSRHACASIVIAMVLGGLASSVSAQTATLSCTVAPTTIHRPGMVTGVVSITPISGSSGSYDLYVNFNDANGRTFDRFETRVNVTAKTNVSFTLSSANALSLRCRVLARGKFTAGTAYGTSSQYVYVIPYTIDYDDFWCNVWGGGTATAVAYFNALKQANVNLGHIARGDSYNGYLYNVRPNNDFDEDKLWFELVSTSPTGAGPARRLQGHVSLAGRQQLRQRGSPEPAGPTHQPE